MFKFSALPQIWKKYIQKLNDWDLPLIQVSLVKECMWKKILQFQVSEVS